MSHSLKRLLCSIALVAQTVVTASLAMAQQAPQAPQGSNPYMGSMWTYAAPPGPPPSTYAYAPQQAWVQPVVVPVEPPKPDAVNANTPPKESSVAFDLSVVNQVPVIIGAQATLEVPYRILFQTELGFLPSAYVNAVSSILASAGAIDQTVADLVRSSLGNSFVFRLSGGFRPFAAHGFEIMGGYTLVAMGGGVSGKQAISAVTGAALPAEIPDMEIPIRSTIHNVHVALGWRWVVADHFVIRASVGYMQAVASSSRIELPDGVPATAAVVSQLEQANKTVDTTLNDTYKTYVKSPTLGLSMGYRF